MGDSFLQRRQEAEEAEFHRLEPPVRPLSPAPRLQPAAPMPRANDAPSIAYLIDVVAELRSANQRYRAALDGLPTGALICETRGEASRIAYVNRALLRLTGYAEEELLEREESEVWRRLLDEETYERLESAKRDDRQDAVAVECYRKDGTLFPAEVSAVKAVDDYGAGHSTVWLLSEARLQSLPAEASSSGTQISLRSKSPEEDFRFTANLIHELRTPLNAIIGFADVLRSEIFGALPHAKYREYAADILESGHHLLELVNEILDLSKADAGRLELSESRVDLVAAVQASVKMIQQTARETSVEVSVAIADDLPRLRADERRVRQILINLLANAVKFTPPGGEVLLTADREADGGLFISVLDTGIGMSAEDLTVALAPFGQVGAAEAQAEQGTGLGLPLTQRLLEAHGGSLEILSSCGQGTIMVGRFPPERVIS